MIIEEESCLNCKYGRFSNAVADFMEQPYVEFSKQTGFCINENTNRIFKNPMVMELLFYAFRCNYYFNKDWEY